jgi:hypothetical protein
MIGLPSRQRSTTAMFQTLPLSQNTITFLFPVHGISCLVARHSLVFTIMHLH